MFVRNPGGADICTPPRVPDAVENARMRRSLCERLQHCVGREVIPQEISALETHSGQTLTQLTELDNQALLGLFLEMSTELGRLVETLKSRGSIVSPDQLAEYALRTGKKLSEIGKLSPGELAELVSEQIERIHRPDKHRSAHLLQIRPS